jgi:serine carboxypeptidase 1
MKMSTIFLLVSSAIFAVRAEIPDESWGYVTVRPGAHSFWWLYGANATPADRPTLPLIMWLQGGPGASSTGYGNFAEMGPLDWYLKPRASAWTNAPANLLFVDNPVGAGFSYVDDLTLLPKTNGDIAKDLVALAAAFFDKYSELQGTPFYVFTESYGAHQPPLRTRETPPPAYLTPHPPGPNRR